MEQLQTDSELPVTGFVDEATARALQDKLAAVGQEQARQTVVLQTILSLVGFWDGPIDGVWTDELTQALMDFQTALGVEPTGVVDAATIAAFQQALANLEAGTPATTAPPPAATDRTADRDHRRLPPVRRRPSSSPTPISARSSPPPAA